MTDTPIIAVEGLEKHFVLKAANPLTGRKAVTLHAVDGITLDIHAGEAVGLVGESGCGKSTLARVLSRLIDATAGRMWIDGRDVSDLSVSRFARSAVRSDIQMVFQDPTDSLNPLFTVFDLIADPLRQMDRPKSRAALVARVEAAVRSVNLPLEFLTRYPHQLSGGQKARVGIARAMVVNPRLLILDEPTSALDVSVQATVLQLLDNLRREQGVALLFVSHDLNVVRLLCSRIVVMYLGQVVESGPTDALFHAPRHPYTQALMSAMPTLRAGARVDRIKLDGEPQSPINPSGHTCRLAGRCPVQRDLCLRVEPVLQPDGAGRQIRCHFPLEQLSATTR
ncbi:ABC transporter ATP-binding protein [Rhodobacteraceae bacterium KMM 6894]|nr:ABC transporter ATP-binding protein [Rhodobacteraceae bacterium KMM 6894]